MTNTTDTASLLRSLLTAYAVHGGDAASSVDMARQLAAEAHNLAALSIARITNGPGSIYRIATLADGREFLAVRRVRRGKPILWLPVFAVARLERLAAEGRVCLLCAPEAR